jgi:hypothetical protein
MGTLTVTYSSVATGETTIGAERFHFRVRNGIGWFPLAMAVREFFMSGMFFDPTQCRVRLSMMDPSSIRLLEVIWSSLTGN